MDSSTNSARVTYFGAIVFPLLALFFGLGTWRCARAVRRRV